MGAERLTTTDRAAANTGQEFVRRFTNLLCELRLTPGIHKRSERILADFAAEHPNLRAAYVSRHVDESYFSDGSCGWQASAGPKLQGIAADENHLYEFLAFAHGLRMHTTPLSTVMNIEELWLESSPKEPFTFRAIFYHSFPATTLIYAPDGESQEAAVSFLRRLKYLRGF